MAEESDEALEISSNEESDTDRHDAKERMDQSTSESLQSGSPTVISLLDSLKSPTPADLSRKRHLRQNPPPKGVKMGKGKEIGDLKCISACERVKSSSPKNTSVGKRSLHWRVKKSLEFRKPYMCMTV